MCPSCARALDEYHYLYHSPIVPHSSPACRGIWVENGDLIKMQDWLDKSRMPKWASQRAKVALAQAKIEQGNANDRSRALVGYLQRLNQNWEGWIGLGP